MKYYLVGWEENVGCEDGAMHKYAVAAPDHVNKDDVAEIILLHLWKNVDDSGPDEEWSYDASSEWWMCKGRDFWEWYGQEIPEADYSVLNKYLGWGNGWPNTSDINWSIDVKQLRKLKEVA